MDPEVQVILGVVRQRTGVDFSRYRTATVQRRIANRMLSLSVGSFEEYLAILRREEDEAHHLLARITIKVSRFFRHAPAWEVLRDHALPELAARGEPVRVWSAGCGCGEEAWTLAMMLEEAGLEGSVLATDIDPGALAAAERGRYDAESVSQLPPELVERYLVPLIPGGPPGGAERSRQVFGLHHVLRRRVRFLRHDLLFASAPDTAPFDLVACRNVLIYLQRDVREEVFGAVRRAVRPGGFLCLGEAEWPSESLGTRLTPLSRQSRVFRVEGGEQ